jgi:hypothetical protein
MTYTTELKSENRPASTNKTVRRRGLSIPVFIAASVFRLAHLCFMGRRDGLTTRPDLHDEWAETARPSDNACFSPGRINRRIDPKHFSQNSFEQKLENSITYSPLSFHSMLSRSEQKQNHHQHSYQRQRGRNEAGLPSLPLLPTNFQRTLYSHIEKTATMLTSMSSAEESIVTPHAAMCTIFPADKTCFHINRYDSLLKRLALATSGIVAFKQLASNDFVLFQISARANSGLHPSLLFALPQAATASD